MPTPSQKGHLIEFDREPIDPYSLFGFALDWSDELNMDTMELNGYSVIRNSDIRKWRRRGPQAFPQRGIARRLAGSSGDRRRPVSTSGAPPGENQSAGLPRWPRAINDREGPIPEEIDTDALWRETNRYRFRDLTKGTTRESAARRAGRRFRVPSHCSASSLTPLASDK
jgi:hypothetical protein